MVGRLAYRLPSGAPRPGFCSSFLTSIAPGTRIRFKLVSQPSFRLPFNPAAPVIMIAAGTGLAPFKVGKHWPPHHTFRCRLAKHWPPRHTFRCKLAKHWPPRHTSCCTFATNHPGQRWRSNLTHCQEGCMRPCSSEHSLVRKCVLWAAFLPTKILVTPNRLAPMPHKPALLESVTYVRP